MSIGGTVHNELKAQARQMLLELGFPEDEIKYEWKAKIAKKTYVVDVVGFKNGEPHTAIECGGISNKDKLVQLRALFEVVERVPYINQSIVRKMGEHEKTIREQTEEIKQLKSRTAFFIGEKGDFRRDFFKESLSSFLELYEKVGEIDKKYPKKTEYRSSKKTLDKITEIFDVFSEDFIKRMKTWHSIAIERQKKFCQDCPKLISCRDIVKKVKETEMGWGQTKQHFLLCPRFVAEFMASGNYETLARTLPTLQSCE